MQPLGNKILVRDIVEEKKSSSGLILNPDSDNYKKVKVEVTSEDSATKLKPGDICLCNRGGVEIEKGLWLCNENLLDCKL